MGAANKGRRRGTNGRSPFVHQNWSQTERSGHRSPRWTERFGRWWPWPDSGRIEISRRSEPL